MPYGATCLLCNSWPCLLLLHILSVGSLSGLPRPVTGQQRIGDAGALCPQPGSVTASSLVQGTLMELVVQIGRLTIENGPVTDFGIGSSEVC